MKTNSYDNTQAQRKCVQQKHISQIVLIALANCYGADITVSIPTSKQSQNTLRGINLTVDSFTLPHDEMNIVLSETTSEINQKEEMKSMSKRNKKVTEDSVKINTLFEFIRFCDPNIQFKEGKNRPSDLTIKQKKVVWIDPFNENGMVTFAELVIEVILRKESEKINGKKSNVELKRRDAEITKAYMTVLLDETMLSEQGKVYRNQIVQQPWCQMYYSQMNIVQIPSEMISYQQNSFSSYPQYQQCYQNYQIQGNQFNQIDQGNETMFMF